MHSIGGDASQPKMPSGGIWTRPQGTAETAITRPEPGDDSPYSRRTGETSIYLQDWRPSPFMAMLYDLVLQRLPSDEMIDLLVSRCRPAMEWHTTLIHWGTLEHEIRLFKAMRSTPAVKQVDPAWVAMLLQVRPLPRCAGADAAGPPHRPVEWRAAASIRVVGERQLGRMRPPLPASGRVGYHPALPLDRRASSRGL